MACYEYVITGMTPCDFIEKHSGLDIDMNQLENDFKKHCTDYMEDLVADSKSPVVHFCLFVLYKIEPESRKLKRVRGNKTWKYVFDVSGQKHDVFIVTHKRETVDYLPHSNGTSMVLSVKEAGLLAQETFSRLIKLRYQSGEKLMTPLALACFSRDDVAKLAEELEMTEVILLQSINQSMMMGDGRHLPMADVDIAICSFMSITRNLKDENLKMSTCAKIAKQYIAKGKMPSKDRIVIISKYTIGGIPVEFAREVLERVINSE